MGGNLQNIIAMIFIISFIGFIIILLSRSSYYLLIFMGERPSYDEYFMEMAHLVAKRSTCLRRNVGAILVKDKHIQNPLKNQLHPVILSMEIYRF